MELAALMVFIGLVIGGILKGIDLIEEAKALRTLRTIDEVRVALVEYNARYGYLPGDDPEAPKRFGRPPSILMLQDVVYYDLTGNHHIDGWLMDSTMPTNEQFMAWNDLRAAGLLSGNREKVGVEALMRNEWKGIIGFDIGNLGLQDTICVTRVPGKAAQMIDEKLDDGKMGTGQVRATNRYDRVRAFNHFEAPDTTEYNPEREYVLCLPYAT